GDCVALTGDASGLFSERLKLKNAKDHTIMAQIISKEPLGPAVSANDTAWFLVVRWTLLSLIQAEELALAMEGAKAAEANQSADLRKFIDEADAAGMPLGLGKDWA